MARKPVRPISKPAKTKPKVKPKAKGFPLPKNPLAGSGGFPQGQPQGMTGGMGMGPNMPGSGQVDPRLLALMLKLRGGQ